MGIVGYGNMGTVHAQSIFEGKIKNMTLAAVCDNNSSRIEAAKEKFGEKTAYFSDYTEMLESGLVDSVLIATPHYSHPEMVISAFDKDFNVLTEKPAGVYTKQVLDMNERASKSDKVFGIMYNQRTNPYFQAVKEFIDSGRLGAPKRLVWIITNWYRTQPYYDSGTWRATWSGEGGGVLINQCPHNLDLWQWMFGMPSKVRAFCSYGKYHNIEVEDDVTIHAEYDNGAVAEFITTTGEAPGTNRLEISGDKAKIVIEDGKMKIWELETPEREFCFSDVGGFDTPKVTCSEIDLSDKPEAGHNGILQNFCNAILKGEKLLAPGEEGINGLTISNAAHLSSWIDDTVDIPFNDSLFFIKLQQKIAGSEAKEVTETKTFGLEGTFNS